MPDTELTISFQQMLENSEISPNEQIFVDQYVATLNKGASFRAAFPTITVDYGRINALLDKSAIKEQISLRIQKNLDGEISRSPAMLFKYVDKFLNMDISDFYRADGTAIPLDEIDEEKRLLVMNISRTVNNKTGQSYVEYTLPNKEKAIDRLLDVVKLLVESRKVVGNEFADEVGEAARMRDQIFNDDPANARPVNEEPKKKDGRGSRVWTEEQRAEMRRKALERIADKKKKDVDDKKEE
jgi:hypothetical protein